MRDIFINLVIFGGFCSLFIMSIASPDGKEILPFFQEAVKACQGLEKVQSVHVDGTFVCVGGLGGKARGEKK